MPATAESLQSFVSYCKQHIRGDEKSEAQTFLTKFFQAFGHEGVKEVGAEFEDRLKKGSSKGKTGFADLVWRSQPGVAGIVVEMKSRGEDLNKHYAQVERYWMRIAPNRPRYAMLCNFDEFWIFDFENQVDEPVDRIFLEDLPARSRALSFMEIGGQRPLFRNNQVEVTEQTARRMGELYRYVYERGKRTQFKKFNEEQIQRFLLQCVLAMFAEDRGLLPDGIFVRLLEECKQGRGKVYDLLGGLFQEMNRPGITPDGRYEGVDYFNGGLFAQVTPIELTETELALLRVCADSNWSNVRPSIFGNIFEGAIDQSQRHAHGIHFTSELDIRQIVRPTISDYWEERINAAESMEELRTLHEEMKAYRVLDPACGSGNFLYVAYQELKRLEKLLLDRIAEKDSSATVADQTQKGGVTPLQFFGMDTNPFAVQLARVTMMIARKIATDKYGLDEPALPLDTLDDNIVCQDALFNEWVQADAIVGNPPFLGGKHMRLLLGDGYIDRVFARFPQVKDSVDFCAYWFRIAHDQLDADGRAGLVATNSVSQGKSRAASLDYITRNGGYIHEAISTQPWSGEAKVHVSLVNWSKQSPAICHLNNKIVQQINSSLKAEIDVSKANKLVVNSNKCFQGVKPVGKDFIVTEKQVKDWIRADSKNQEVLKLFSMGENLASYPHGKPKRWIIDFNEMSIEDASEYTLPFNYIKTNVKPVRDSSRDEQAKKRWWRFERTRPEMRKAITGLSFYITVPRVSKWAMFTPASMDWLAGDKSVVVASEDFYLMGLLLSEVHRTWMNAQKSTLKADVAYTPTTCFETFPFPQLPSNKQVQQIRDITEELHTYRSSMMTKKQWGITQLYNQFFSEPASELCKLHNKLDQLVLKAYGFKTGDDILEKLLALNAELAEKEKQGEPVVGPWSPFDPSIKPAVSTEEEEN